MEWQNPANVKNVWKFYLLNHNVNFNTQDHHNSIQFDLVTQHIMRRMRNTRPTSVRRQALADEIRRCFQGTTTRRGRPTDYLHIRINCLWDPSTTTNTTINIPCCVSWDSVLSPERTRSRKRNCSKIPSVSVSGIHLSNSVSLKPMADSTTLIQLGDQLNSFSFFMNTTKKVGSNYPTLYIRPQHRI